MSTRGSKKSEYSIGVSALGRIVQECLRRYALEFVARPGSSRDPREFTQVTLEEIVWSLSDHVDSWLSVAFLTHTLCFFALGTFEAAEKDVIYLKNSFKVLLEFRLKRGAAPAELGDATAVRVTADPAEPAPSELTALDASRDSLGRPVLDRPSDPKKRGFVESASEGRGYLQLGGEGGQAGGGGGSRRRGHNSSIDFSADKKGQLRGVLSSQKLQAYYEEPVSLFNVYQSKTMGSPKQQHNIYKGSPQRPGQVLPRPANGAKSTVMDSAQEKLERARERFGEAATITEQDLQSYKFLKEAPSGKAPQEHTLRSMEKEGLDVRSRQKTLQVLHSLKRSDKEWYHLPPTPHEDAGLKGLPLPREQKELGGFNQAGRLEENSSSKLNMDIMRLLDKTKGNLGKHSTPGRVAIEPYKPGNKR